MRLLRNSPSLENGLRNVFHQEGFEEEAKGVHNLIERRNIDNKPEYVLQSESSYPYLQEHIQKFGSPDVTESPGEEEELLKSAFDIITGNTSDIVGSVRNDPSISNEAKKTKLLQKLVEVRAKILGLKVIYITLDNEDDAYVIFETLNTRGRDLTVGDLLKSHLTKLIKARNAKVDVTKDRWNQIVKRIESSEREIDVFLYHHWLSKHEKYVPAKKLFKSIKREVKSENARAFLDDLDKDSKIYSQILKPSQHRWTKNERSIQDSLRALDIFKLKQPIPMVLSIMRDYRTGRLKPKYTQDILRTIENFHFVFSAVTSQRSSGGISSMYSSHAIKLANAGDHEDRVAILASLKGELAKRLPSFQEFEVDFADIGYAEGLEKNKKLVQYMLARIDAYFEKGLPIDYEQMTIEHLASQNPREGHTIPPECVQQIGNLLLVSTDLNVQLGNKAFASKKKILESSRVWLDDVVKDASDWGVPEIERRTKLLAHLAYHNVWPI
jgi:hypothetical protein